MSADIFYILLSICALLLCGIFVSVILLLMRQWKKWHGSDLGLLQNQILSLSKTVDDKLTQGNMFVNKSMSESLKASSHIADRAITKKLTEISETNKEIKDIWNRLEGLENILKNPKRRGNLGEYFLKELLENVFTPDQYKLQFTLSSWVVDAALFIGNISKKIFLSAQNRYTKTYWWNF